MSDRYLKRGVSSQKEDVHQAIRNLDKGLYPNAFCKLTEDFLGGDPAYCNIVHADGAGTKSSLAYLYWKETGDLSVWRGIAQDAIVMNLDDMLCVGAADRFLLSSTIGRNKFNIPGEVVSEIIEGTAAFCASMKTYGIHIENMGGETADVGDLVRTVIVDSTFAARIKRQDVVEINIKPGDVIVGLASYGQTTYEQDYNAGMGSNGLTSARHDLLDSSYKSYAESYDSLSGSEYFYTGRFRITDPLPETPVNIGKAILSPTRTYAPVLKQMLDEYRTQISGIIHCTGGGQTKVMKFADKVAVHKNNLLPVPPLFKTIRETTGTSSREMFEVFNMGHRMEIYTNEKTAGQLIRIAESFGLESQIIGECKPSERKSLHISYNSETIEWNF